MLDVENYGEIDLYSEHYRAIDPDAYNYEQIDMDIENYVGIDLDTDKYAHWLLGDRYGKTFPKVSQSVSWHEIQSKSILS